MRRKFMKLSSLRNVRFALFVPILFIGVATSLFLPAVHGQNKPSDPRFRIQIFNDTVMVDSSVVAKSEDMIRQMQSLFQLGDSVELFKLPKIAKGLMLEMFGDSAVGSFFPGQQFFVPSDNGKNRFRHERPFRRSRFRADIQPATLSDTPVLMKGGIRKSNFTRPGFNDEVNLSTADSLLTVTINPADGGIKKLEIKLIEYDGRVNAVERIKNFKGSLNRVYALEPGKWYYLALSDGKRFFCSKINVTKYRFPRKRK